jgi:hypothetical protein
MSGRWNRSTLVPPGIPEDELIDEERTILRTALPMLRAVASGSGNVASLILCDAQEAAIRHQLSDLASALSFMATAAVDSPSALDEIIRAIEVIAHRESDRVHAKLLPALKRLGMENVAPHEALDELRKRADARGIWPDILGGEERPSQ